MAEIHEWAAPPERRAGKYDSVFAELDARPGEWAVIFKGEGSSASSTKRRLKGRYGDVYEMRVSAGRLYARRSGQPGAAPPGGDADDDRELAGVAAGDDDE